MGAKGSKVKRGKPTELDFEWLEKNTKFTHDEIQILWKRFKSLSNSQTKDYMIDVHEFQTAMGFKANEFTRRIFEAFDSDGSAKIDFMEFVMGLHALSPRATIQDKAKFCFSVYDIDRNGFIERSELREVLLFSLGANSAVKLPEDQLEKVIQSTFAKMDKNGDDQIEYAEFEQEAIKNPTILSCVNLVTILLLSVYVLHVPVAGSLWVVGLLSLLVATGLAKVPAIKGLIMDDVITTQNPSTMLKMHENAIVVIDKELADAVGYKG